MTTFLQDEQGVQTSQPREAYEIVTPAETWRLASGIHEVEIDGNTYTASPIRRESIAVSSSSDPQDMQLTLPVSHALVERYLYPSGPPITIAVRVLRYQVTSGQYETIRYGMATSLSINGNVASLLVPGRAAAAGRRRLPTVTAGRSCSHILYDQGCLVARASFKVATTIASFSGRTVTVASMGANPDGWATFGELVRVSTGERILIADQTGNVLTLQLPLVGLAGGESVEVYAGCAHDVATCALKFDNVVNFGGQPHMPTTNTFKPPNGKLGVYTSS
jgi:uncharacterized phage protein (TIGR02218 family)